MISSAESNAFAASVRRPRSNVANTPLCRLAKRQQVGVGELLMPLQPGLHAAHRGRDRETCSPELMSRMGEILGEQADGVFR